MTDPKTISIQDYSYTLPEEKIAAHPLEERDGSRLIIYEKGEITETFFRNIDSLLPANSIMIFNNTKVIEARLLFKKPTGGVIEIFCLQPNDQINDISKAMLMQKKVQWKCLIGGASKWKPGQVLDKTIHKGNTELKLRATYLAKAAGNFIIEFSWSPSEFSFAEVLHLTGAMPLPPYIKREVVEEDADRYQTVYAYHEGSVAAPTAGLHFTRQVLEDLEMKNISPQYITLHVGAGTFQPVKSETLQGHEMHSEYFEVSGSIIKNILQASEKQIIAVGTTSLRTIESLYWLGVKQLAIGSGQWAVGNTQLPVGSMSELGQWEAYELEKNKVPVKQALESLLDLMEKNKMEKLVVNTRLLIAPGYSFKIVKGLVTNFHQPRSTLLLLVAAFIGDDWRKIYTHALKNDFRFLSYGDACLLWRR